MQTIYTRFSIIIFFVVMALSVNARNYYDACVYHLKGNVRSYKIFYSDGEIHDEVQFNRDGKVISKDGKDVYEHDEMGYPSSNTVGILKVEYVFEAPKQHKSDEELHLNAKFAVGMWLYSYNERGELIKTENYKKSLADLFKDERPHFTGNTIYEVLSSDSRGNWTKRNVKEYDVDGKLKDDYIETAEITYWDEVNNTTSPVANPTTSPVANPTTSRISLPLWINKNNEIINPYQLADKLLGCIPYGEYTRKQIYDTLRQSGVDVKLGNLLEVTLLKWGPYFIPNCKKSLAEFFLSVTNENNASYSFYPSKNGDAKAVFNAILKDLTDNGVPMDKGDNSMVKQIYYGTHKGHLIQLIHDKIAGNDIIFLRVVDAAKK